MHKVLIVGGAGYVGGALTDAIINHNITSFGDKIDFRVYDSLLFEEAFLKPVPFIRGDVRDHESLQEHLEWCDTVVWLAAIVGDGACAVNPKVTIEVNLVSVEWLTREFPDKNIIFMSTCSVYGAGDGILTEDSPTNPLSLYAKTKLESESHLTKVNSTIFRLGTLFGVGDNFSRIRVDLVANTMTTSAHMNRLLSVFGGEQFRPLLHVRDVATSIISSILSPKPGIYNLHHSNWSMIELAETVQKIVPDTKIEVVDMSFEDNRNYKVSSYKALYELGFAPSTDVVSGIEEFYGILREGRIVDPNSPRYSNHGFLESKR